MSTITLEKTEYSKIKRQANAYQKLAGKVFNSILRDPINEVVGDFEKTNIYSKDFLRDLKDGLLRSSYNKE